MKWQKQVATAAIELSPSMASQYRTTLNLQCWKLNCADKPLKLTIERTLDEEQARSSRHHGIAMTSTCPLVSGMRIGLQFRAGGITTVLKDSVAETAGIREGDRFLKVNGEAIS